jgi:4,5-dihydroxyphthalate decarboxylase
MAGLKLTLACSPSDRSRPVLSGEVPIEGCEPELVTREAAELLRAAARETTYDVTEMSMSSHLVLTARETPHYIAIPAFHSRLFRHSSIYINTASGIGRPEDLAGKRVGVQEYQQTAALWVRGMLADDYGVDVGSMLWRTGGVEKPGGSERVPIKLPDHIKVEPIGPGKTLSAMLAAGEIDALISPRQPSAFGVPTVERLFPDYRKAEEDYYRRTRLFPIMHGIGVRRSLAEKDPWLPGAVYKAFCEGRRRALQDLTAFGVLRVTLPWVRAALDEAQALMGPEVWPYGFEPNLPELKAMARYAHEQGLADRVIDPAEMFHPSVLGDPATDPWRDEVD